jgi:hypothetical protein
MRTVRLEDPRLRTGARRYLSAWDAAWITSYDHDRFKTEIGEDYSLIQVQVEDEQEAIATMPKIPAGEGTST